MKVEKTLSCGDSSGFKQPMTFGVQGRDNRQ